MSFYDGTEEGKGPVLKDEIIGILLITAGVLCLAALLFTDSMGIIGEFINRKLMMAIGGGAFLPPIFVLACGINLMLNRGFNNVMLRITGLLFFFLVFVTAIHLPLPENTDISIGLAGKGGGALGALLTIFLLDAFGEVGTYVLLVSVTLISLILMLDVPLVLAISVFLKRIGSGIMSFFYAIWRGVKGIGSGFLRLAEKGLSFFPDDEVINQREVSREESYSQLQDQPKKSKSKGRRSRRETKEDTVTVGIDTSETRTKKEESTNVSSSAVTLEQLKLIEPKSDYSVPPLTFLNASPTIRSKESEVDQSELLVETFKNFAININVVEVTRGPVVTRYEVQPAPGVKVSRIVSLADDLALSLAAPDIRIEAPIPGKSVIGIEVPNKRSTTVYAREILESSKFRNSKNPLLMALGRDIAGETVVADLKEMVHLLVAGATGSGKSVCMNMIISSLLFKSSPDIVKFIMIDPKVVELSIYNGIPHLLTPVVTDPKKAALTLSWVVKEMDRRYKMFAKSKSRNIESHNRWALSMMMAEETESLKEEVDEGATEPTIEEEKPEFFPYIVVIIDELADLMMVAPGDVEDAICRLAQKARAAGIHLVLATQRPSTDVITGLIKANIPSRIAFAVSSAVDSRIILDSGGAERLLGKGDMLFHPMGASKITRVQGALITDKEIERLVEFLKGQSQPQAETSISLEEVAASTEEFHDELFDDAIELVLQSGQASASMLQRRLRIGYTRAARLIDMMEDRGIVGPHEGSKPRVVLISEEEWRERKEEESQ